MRKYIVIFAIAAALGSTGIGRAASLPVSCGGSAPGYRHCTVTFTISSPTAVNMALIPGVGYTGTLRARLNKGTAPVNGWTIAAYYVAGQTTPLANLPTAIDAGLLEPGTYTMIVEAAKLVQACGGGWACTPNLIPPADTFAAGDWSAEVVETDAVA